MQVAAAQPELVGDSRKAAELWHGAMARLSTRVSPHVLQTWFVPTRPVTLEGTALTLGVPSNFHADWLRDHYQDVLEAELRSEQPGCRLRFQVMPELEAPAAGGPASVTRADANRASTPPSAVRERLQTSFNPRYTLDGFVRGPSNQLAAAAADAITDKPGSLYNPLFVFGGVGLGKTHLLHAVGQAIQQRHPEWNVLYVSAEDFANDLIACLQNGRMENFRHRWRGLCDVLLLDDVHFLGSKERTQEEFFHVFNHHHQLGRQIVVTSDRFPHEMAGVEERLRNRLQWGLIVDIQPPELETRMAILGSKAAAMGVRLPDEVSHFLASHIRQNVRELEGALTRVVAASSVHGRVLNVDLCRTELRDLSLARARTPTCEEIQKHVCSLYNVNITEMRGPRRNRGITTPRHVAMYLCRKHTQASFPEIGAAFGGKDHTTVMASVRKIEELVRTDPAVTQAVEALDRILQA
ncbi:MAG: chromosomal replication initiator protein DnaA [Deltaproteobacteria bacterium]|nr:chromosomal replication initiator protein DnaA [Deltaproteobacteria bacterium]